MEIIKPITKSTLLSQGTTNKMSKSYIKDVEKKFEKPKTDKEILDGVKFNSNVDDKQIEISDYNRGLEDYDYQNEIPTNLKKRLKSYVIGKDGKDNQIFTKKAERKSGFKTGSIDLYGKMPVGKDDVKKNGIFESIKDVLKKMAIGDVNETLDMDTLTKVVDAVDKVSTSGDKPSVTIVKDQTTQQPKIQITKESLTTEGVARKYIPESLKFNKSKFIISDGVNEYKFMWEKDDFINEGILTDYVNKKVIKENVDKTFKLMNYTSPKTGLGGKERHREDIIFNEMFKKLNDE
jgi:hypothetical protein